MVAIRQIIAVGCLMASFGCGPNYPFAGEWVGERNLEFRPGTAPYVANTFKQVKLQVTAAGSFVLTDESIPMEGKLELGSKSQSLDIERVAGRATNRPDAAPKPHYMLKWVDNSTIELASESKPRIILHRVSKPSS